MCKTIFHIYGLYDLERCMQSVSRIRRGLSITSHHLRVCTFTRYSWFSFKTHTPHWQIIHICLNPDLRGSMSASAWGRGWFWSLDIQWHPFAGIIAHVNTEEPPSSCRVVWFYLPYTPPVWSRLWTIIYSQACHVKVTERKKPRG